MRFRTDHRGRVDATVTDAAERAVADAVEALLTEANRTVPIEDDTLERSGKATTDGLSGAVSYDTPYAARQHEETTWRHDPGRRSKWLEHTWREQAKPVGEFIAGRIRSEVG